VGQAMRNPALLQRGQGIEEYRRHVRETLAPHRLELLERQARWIRSTEEWIKDYFINGDSVDISGIRPKLELVTTERQHAVWRYCRCWGSIPYNRGCGRLLRYMLRDEGQSGCPVMGVMSLSSPVLINKPRDNWIGWQYPRDLDLKRRRLLTCMELSVSMAVAPYNVLTAGKMICLAALSNEVRQDYRKKFRSAKTPTGISESRLALVTTTSLYGSSVQYNRIKVGGMQAYKLIGYTSGFGNAHLTEEEFRNMELTLRRSGVVIPKGWGSGRSYRLRVYTAYCRLEFKADKAPPHENHRSVYVAPLASNALPFLRGECNKLEPYDRPFERMADLWRERWLESRLRKPDVVDRFRASNPLDHLLSKELPSSD
jgi:hypothetical protein